MSLDIDRATLKHPDMFRRFRIVGDGKPIRSAGLRQAAQLLVFERKGQRRALVRDQMVYHHVAQGKLAGEPYLITF